MDNIIELLTSKEVIVVYIVIAVACLLCFIIYLVDRNQDKRKRKQNTKELNKLVEDVNEANDALDSVDTNNTIPMEDTNSAVMVADGVDVVEETSEIPLGPIQEEQKKFMPEPSDLQAYNSFAEELEDDGPVREEQVVVANTDVVNVPVANDVVPATTIPVPNVPDVPNIPMEDNMVLDHMNQELDAEGAAPAVEVPVEDITISSETPVPERERIEEIVYTNPEPTEEEATRELQKITEELEKAARGETINPVSNQESNISIPEENLVTEENVPGPEEFVPPVGNIVEEVSSVEPVDVPEENNEVSEVVPETVDIPVPNIPEPPVEEVSVPEEVETPMENAEPASEEVEPSTEEEISVPETSNNIDVAKYENDQEENAIISLEELTRKSEEMYAANEETQYADEGDEPISLEDLERRKQQIINSEVNEEVEDGNNPVAVESNEVEEEVLDEVGEKSMDDTLEELIEEHKSPVEELEPEQLSFDDSYEESKRKFHTSPVISPVFGFDRSDSISNKERIEQKKKADAFLTELKDLQNRLNAN